MPIAVKICGITDAKALQTAVEADAAFVGFVFFRHSPRVIDTATAAKLTDLVPRAVTSVGLFVDPTDTDLKTTLGIVDLDALQLHGHETPERVNAIRKTFGLPVMKAVGVSTARDVAAAMSYIDAADWLLFDAKPAADATRPGGNAAAFDWGLMRTYTGKLPWMLAGGLTAKNVQAAIVASGARGVDVSSGVESAPGVKSAAKIRSFINAARAGTG
jgi:phosphoribosylanthranilate isomerase